MANTVRDVFLRQPTLSFLRPFLQQVHTQARHHAVLYYFIGFCFIVFLIFQHLYDVTSYYDTGVFFLYYCFIILFLLSFTAALVKYFKIATSNCRDNPSRQLFIWAQEQILKDGRFGNGVHGCIIMMVTILIFTTVKTAIPLVHPFQWDKYFMEMDRIIFLGNDPWTLLNMVLGTASVTSAISVLYNIWIIVVAIVLTLALFSGSSQLRLQFLTSTVLSWIIAGNILALVFSSAGPCYYGFVVEGDNPFAAQMEYLNSANTTNTVLSLPIQELLWTSYIENEGKISGISAMPSLHIIFALLIAFYAARLNRAAGAVCMIYAVIIMIGSVHLAWHYAVDGIAALLLAVVIWRLSGWLVRNIELRSPQ